ncbi:hypothetical protein IP88_08555 [alpha proteobacterium AAP81b]|nr:hypothetical protein IP88_08555 [alpha proteobacterium AAP81b]
MSFHPPQSLADEKSQRAAQSSIEAAIVGEMATSLGVAGRRVELSLAALRRLDRADAARPEAVMTAARAVHAYFIQRELCGFRDQRGAIRDFAIPGEVLVKVGVR